MWTNSKIFNNAQQEATSLKIDREKRFDPVGRFSLLGPQMGPVVHHAPEEKADLSEDSARS